MWSLLHREIWGWVRNNHIFIHQLKSLESEHGTIVLKSKYQTSSTFPVVLIINQNLIICLNKHIIHTMCNFYFKKNIHYVWSPLISLSLFVRYFTFLVECKNPKACTILLRGASKDILNEVERNLQDAMNVCRNVMLEPYLVPGGGAAEMALSQVSVIIKYRAFSESVGCHTQYQVKLVIMCRHLGCSWVNFISLILTEYCCTSFVVWMEKEI